MKLRILRRPPAAAAWCATPRGPAQARAGGLLRTLLLAIALGIASPIPAAAQCVKTGEFCAEGPATRDIGGHPVYRECWRTTSTYSCAGPTMQDDCQGLRERGCSQVDSVCIDTDPSGNCTVYEQGFQCRIASGTTRTVTDCGERRFCLEGNCFDASHRPDPDFARAVTAMEAQREAGKYLDASSLTLFQGHDNRCNKKLFGLINCCRGGGSGATGQMLSTLSLARGAVGQAGSVLGSSYTYDALFTADAPQIVIAGFERLFGAGGGSSALAGLMAGDVSVSSFIQGMVPGPWSIAMLAIQLSGLLSCEQADQILALKRDQRLCRAVGSYCSMRVPITRTCVQTTETQCCFNSRLARILNEQARAQMGRGWGSAQQPECQGLSPQELQALDFSRLDLSEFYEEIVPADADPAGRIGQAQQRIRSLYPDEIRSSPGRNRIFGGMRRPPFGQ
jgi:conjugal transfer mating pair stabilization protein TraN